MVEQTDPDAFADGVSGKGQKWKDRVDTDDAEQNYTGGATSENASKLTDNAKDGKSDYEQNLATAFGLDSIDNDVSSDWEDGLDSDAETEWVNQTGGAGDRWRGGVQDTSASDWEDETSEAAQEWYSETREGLSPD